MKESGKERFIFTKSYEIAYALFRLAASLKEADFAEQLRASAATLLSAAAAEDYVAAGLAIQVLECLVKFAGDVNLINATNVDLTLREIYALEAAVTERRNAAKTDEVDVAEIFSKPEIAAPARETSFDEPPATFDQIEPSIRQSTILDRIRQSGNCRMKDIQDILPDTSERTIRYDLQTLLEHNLIERVGAGPAVFYRAIDTASGR